MEQLNALYYFFSPHTDARERAVATFFKGLTEHSSQATTRARLGKLLQRDIAAINLWTEFRYKGYRYLGKPERKKLYTNLQLIAEDFDRFFVHHAESADAIMSQVHQLAPQADVEQGKVLLLQALMDYFSPQRGLYVYRDSSSFGRLLRDPQHEKLVGDCNQIVTLYIHLFARYFDVHDLQIRSLPSHVALHYGGVDIETTQGTFANYASHRDSTLQPIEEIVSINLLDTTDTYLATHEIAAEDLLQASRIAYILSHDRAIVAHNLESAYIGLVNMLMKRNNYTKALDFALASNNAQLLSVVGQNGTVHEMERHNYAAARRFAQYAPKKDELLQNLWQAEGAQHYQSHRYHDAIKAFNHAGKPDLVRQCYVGLYFEEQGKLGANSTAESLKNQPGTIKRMHGYAKKSGNKQLLAHAEGLLKHL